MAKKLSMVSVVLSLVVVLALVYFFRPQTFSFLKQGFASGEDDFEDDFEEEGFADDVDEFEDDVDEAFTSGSNATAGKRGT